LNQLRLAKIFLAEDNPDDLEITLRALKRGRLGCELIVARDGEEALDILRRPEVMPHIALLDINLPKLSGLEVLEKIRREPCGASLPVIMLSASNRHEDVLRSYELGANSYIQKPVVFDDFVDALAVLYKYWFELARLPRSL
jgi:two-component system response regulator